MHRRAITLRAVSLAALIFAASPLPAAAMYGRLKTDLTHPGFTGGSVHHPAGSLVPLQRDDGDKWVISLRPYFVEVAKSDVDPIPQVMFANTVTATANRDFEVSRAVYPEYDKIRNLDDRLHFHAPIKAGDKVTVTAKTADMYYVLKTDGPCCTMGYVKADAITLAPGQNLATISGDPTALTASERAEAARETAPEYTAGRKARAADERQGQFKLMSLLAVPVLAFLWVFIGTKIAGEPGRRARLWAKRRHKYIFNEASGAWYPVSGRSLTGEVMFKPQEDKRAAREARELMAFKHRLVWVPLILGGGYAMSFVLGGFGANPNDPIMWIILGTMAIIAAAELAGQVFGLGMVIDPPGRVWPSAGHPFGPDKIAPAPAPAAPPASTQGPSAKPAAQDDGLTYRPGE